MKNQAIQNEPVKCFWILDGFNKSYDQRHTIKSLSGYFDKDHKAWCINSPTPEVVSQIKRNGLVLQFRRFVQINNL
jgi:hypothetical protein